VILEEGRRVVTFPVIKIRQPVGEIYIGSMSAKALYDIAFFDIRRLENRELDEYLGIQRDLSQKRVETIQLYVQGKDATFPTSVVLAVDERCVKLEQACESRDDLFDMTLSNFSFENDAEQISMYRSIARVIDGQHRIAGLANYDGQQFDINVSIFVGADIADQAMVFSIVNLAQTKVNRSLVYDLFSLSRHRSPEKSAHNIAVALDRTEGSPLFKRIKRLGTATVGRVNETLSQATVVSSILLYISGDPNRVLIDRQIGQRRGKWPPVSREEAEKLVLRPMFVEDRDTEIAKLIWNYLEAVQERWPQAWNSFQQGNMLNRTNGFEGLMKFFRPAYRASGRVGQMVGKGEFFRTFQKSSLLDDDFTVERFRPGTSGSTDLYKALLVQTGLEA
jgi:DGQHR domain-containing protein